MYSLYQICWCRERELGSPVGQLQQQVSNVHRRQYLCQPAAPLHELRIPPLPVRYNPFRLPDSPRQLKRSRLSQGLGVGYHQVCLCVGSLKGTSRPAIGFPGGRPRLHLSICKLPSDAYTSSCLHIQASCLLVKRYHTLHL
jgi:hypothetical protein